MKKNDFDFYVGNKMSGSLLKISTDIFGMYAVCKTLDVPELSDLTKALKQTNDAIGVVLKERNKVYEKLDK